MALRGGLRTLLRVPCSGIDVVRWRAGKISLSDAGVVISLMVYNTVLIDRASKDPSVGQPGVLLAARTKQSQLGHVLGRSLPLRFNRISGSVRHRPLHCSDGPSGIG